MNRLTAALKNVLLNATLSKDSNQQIKSFDRQII